MSGVSGKNLNKYRVVHLVEEKLLQQVCSYSSYSSGPFDVNKQGVNSHGQNIFLRIFPKIFPKKLHIKKLQ